MTVWGEDETPDVHALAGAYAVDAVDDVERARFERHLEACAACREEVRSLQATAALLGASRSEQPPSALRASVLEAAARTRQDRPAPAESGTRVRRWVRLLPAAAAVLLVATLALGGALVINADRLDDARQEARQLESRLDRLTAESSVDLAGGGRLELVRGEGAAIVELVDAPAPAEGRTYQLWLVTPAGEASSAGLLRSGTGSAFVERLGSAAALAVTEEPAGGSEQPTMEPLGVVPLAS
jgi:anti-sigma-K factor RskA